MFGRHWQDESWHEVLSLLAGLLSARFVGDIVKSLLSAKDPERSYLHVFLAAACVSEVRLRGELGQIPAQVS